MDVLCRFHPASRAPRRARPCRRSLGNCRSALGERLDVGPLFDRRHPPVSSVPAVRQFAQACARNLPQPHRALSAHDGSPRGATDDRDRIRDRIRTAGVMEPSLRAAKRRRFHGEWIATKSEARLRLLKPLNLETTMLLDHPFDGPTAIRTHIAAIFISLELSRSNWLVTSLSPGKGEKMSKHSVAAGD